MTVQQFIDAMKFIGFTAAPIGKHVVDGKTPFKWLINLNFRKRDYSFEYTMGAAHVCYPGKDGQPVPYHVL